MTAPIHLTSCALLGLLLGSSAAANPVSCEQGGLIRKVEVVYLTPGQGVPCEVIYDKSAEGSIQTLGRSSYEAGYCEARATELIEKLSAMGWLCAATDSPDPTTDSGSE